MLLIHRLDALVNLPDRNGHPGKTGARVMAMQRGVMPEADTLLDYMVWDLPTDGECHLNGLSSLFSQEGVYDALEKGYLKTFVRS